MKNVVSNSEVGHLWYHETQARARNGKNTLYFQGPTIYSYGSHFPIARIVRHGGAKAVLFTTRSYTNTTARHISYTRRAIPASAIVFRVEKPTEAVTIETLKGKEKEAAEAVAKSKHSRKYKALHLSRAQDLLNEARSMASFFCLDYEVAAPEELDNLAEKIEEARKEEAQRQREAAAKRLQEAQEDLEAWKRHEISYTGKLHVLTFSYARIQENELVTTKGARVPLEHVKKAAPIVRALIENGRTYKRNGHTIHLGHYVLDEIKEDGTLIAGCHTFERAEVLRILDMVEKA
jgi:hypothetical protein